MKITNKNNDAYDVDGMVEGFSKFLNISKEQLYIRVDREIEKVNGLLTPTGALLILCDKDRFNVDKYLSVEGQNEDTPSIRNFDKLVKYSRIEARNFKREINGIFQLTLLRLDVLAKEIERSTDVNDEDKKQLSLLVEKQKRKIKFC